ncbi:MAG: hypothetical protein ACRYGR_01715 [Janthinobacterium lividum]
MKLRFFLIIWVFIFSPYVALCTAILPKKVMFIAHTETINGKGIYEIYQKMKEKGHQVTVFAIPDLKNDQLRHDLDLNFFQKFDKNDVAFPCGKQKPYTQCASIQNDRFDYAIIQNPYDSFKDSILETNFSLENIKKIAIKTAYIPYGPHIFHPATLNNTHLREKIDLVFVDSISTKNLYIEKLKFKPEKVEVVGYQTYKNVRDAKKLAESHADKKEFKETILWMPRWTLHFKERELNEGGSTFLSYYHFFYNYAKNNPNVQLIMRPHGSTFPYAVESQFLSQDDVDEIVKKFESLKNVVVSSHSAIPLEQDIMKADIVISDGSSALGEAVVANKPIIYLSNGWDNEFKSNELVGTLKNYIYMAHDPKEILAFFDVIRKTNYYPFIEEDYETLDHMKLEYYVAANKNNGRSALKKILDPVDDPAAIITEYISAH